MEINKYNVDYEYFNEDDQKEEDNMNVYITQDEINEKIKEQDISEDESIKMCVERFVRKWSFKDFSKILKITEKENIIIENE